MLKALIICVLAGLGAGITTGFAGLSAAVFITPMLTLMLDVSFYDAVGTALASDVLASTVSAVTYAKSGNIDLKRGMPLMVSVWVAAILGSVAAYFVSYGETGNTVMSWWSVAAALFMGLSLTFRANRQKKPMNFDYSKRRTLVIILCGVYIGFVCGFQGTGGGMMLLMALTIVMSFDFKRAIGTSVFIMAFTALIGMVTHFSINGIPDLRMLVLCVASTTCFAEIGALIANRISDVRLKRVTGVILTVSSVFMILFKIL